MSKEDLSGFETPSDILRLSAAIQKQKLMEESDKNEKRLQKGMGKKKEEKWMKSDDSSDIPKSADIVKDVIKSTNSAIVERKKILDDEWKRVNEREVNKEYGMNIKKGKNQLVKFAPPNFDADAVMEEAEGVRKAEALVATLLVREEPDLWLKGPGTMLASKKESMVNERNDLLSGIATDMGEVFGRPFDGSQILALKNKAMELGRSSSSVFHRATRFLHGEGPIARYTGRAKKVNATVKKCHLVMDIPNSEGPSSTQTIRWGYLLKGKFQELVIDVDWHEEISSFQSLYLSINNVRFITPEEDRSDSENNP